MNTALKTFVSVAATLMSSAMSLARAEIDPTLVAPSASIVFYVHGHLNVVFSSSTTTDSYAEFVQGKQESAFVYDVETRIPGSGEEGWTASEGALSKYTDNNGEFRDTTRFYWLGTSDIDASVEVRARIRITKEGDPKFGDWSEWASLGTAEAVDELRGDVIVSGGSVPLYADDGDLNTYYEDKVSSPAWTGIDAGSEACVTRIRFTHRNYNSTVIARAKGAVFEAANASDFSDAVSLYVVPNDYNPSVVNDVVLATPARARYFRVRAKNFCNFTEVQWVGNVACGAAVLGDGGADDFRARVTTAGDCASVTSFRLLRGYSAEGPFAAVSEPMSELSEPVVDATSGVGLPCYYCWECSFGNGLVMTGLVSSVYVRPRQLERDATDQTKFRDGVLLLPENVLFPVLKYSGSTTAGKKVACAFDGNLETSPNCYCGTTNPVVGVELPVSAHLSCVYVNADCQNSTRTTRMSYLAVYGASSRDLLEGGQYVQLANRIDSYQQSDDRKWFRYDSTDTNGLYACLFGFVPPPPSNGLWCGHSREIRFVGWTEEDAIASGKVLAPAGVSVCCGNGVTVSWTAAVNATTLKIERRPQGEDDWTLVADDVDPQSLSYVDTARLRGKKTYEYRVTATGLGGLMSKAAEPVAVEIPPKGLILIFR